ncbi:hypothetical protein [Kitasatospora sp. NPDC001547]|uniref:effector-associated constant component EACC1 n=1 Tax=Kitasatospora sp. NPDC001547 TaxID=3364015 RepID=UPI00369633E3|nr:hypothetical protein KitaXyl93_69410 [Kitasatospora sp. Xyl93]
MDARIRVAGGDGLRETAELRDWLRRGSGPAGAVRPLPVRPADGEPGGTTEVLEIALGGGGAGAALAGALSEWLRTRHPDVSLEVTTRRGRVTLTAGQPEQARAVPLLAEVLGDDDE